MKVTEREIELIPNTGNQYATMGMITDDLQDYIVIMDRTTGHCYVEAIQEISGKSGDTKVTVPIGGWDTYFEEDSATPISPYAENKNEEWKAVITYVIRDSGLVTTDRLRLAYNNPDNYNPWANIWIPPAFGNPTKVMKGD